MQRLSEANKYRAIKTSFTNNDLVEVSVTRSPPHLEPIVRYLRNGLETKPLHDHGLEQRMVYFDLG